MSNCFVSFYRYQHKCDELEIHERDFNSKYSHAEKEKRDIVLYLKRAVAQKEDELSDLSERLISLNQSKEAEKETFELQLSQLRQEFQEVKDKLTSENIVLGNETTNQSWCKKAFCIDSTNVNDMDRTNNNQSEMWPKVIGEIVWGFLPSYWWNQFYQEAVAWNKHVAFEC